VTPAASTVIFVREDMEGCMVVYGVCQNVWIRCTLKCVIDPVRFSFPEVRNVRTMGMERKVRMTRCGPHTKSGLVW
jgi:hypothetical protein